MDVIVIFNGLGNQMSQYAFYLEKKLRNRQTTYFVLNPRSTYELERLFGIPYRSNLMCRMIYKLLDKAYFSNHLRLKKILRTALNAVGIRLIVEPITRNYSLSNFTHHPGLTFYRGGWHSTPPSTPLLKKPKKPPTKPWAHSPKACPQAWATSSAKLAPQSKYRSSETPKSSFQTTFGLSV